MSARDESSDLAARNAALRNQIDDMLADLRERTAQLREKQDAAAAKTHEVTSEDGVITVRVDATGIVQQLSLGPKAFERSTPEGLAEQITSVIREATGTAQRELRAEVLAHRGDPGDVLAQVGAPDLHLDRAESLVLEGIRLRQQLAVDRVVGEDVLVLGREVVEERSRRDTGFLRDEFRGGLPDSAFRREFTRGRVDRVPRPRPTSFTKGWFCGLHPCILCSSAKDAQLHFLWLWSLRIA